MMHLNIRMVTTPRMDTIQLQPFLRHMILALKKSYRTGIWLSNFITGRAFGKDAYLDGRHHLMEDDL